MALWTTDEIINGFEQDPCQNVLYGLLYDLYPKIQNTLGAAQIIVEELDKNETISSSDLKKVSDVLLREATILAESFDAIRKANQKILGHDKYIDLGE